MTYLRLKINKINNLRFLSHLEMQKLLERSLRRIAVPMKYSEGFNPHTNISFAAPLPVGIASVYEIVDVEILEEIDIDELLNNQQKYLPKDFSILGAKIIFDKSSLMSDVVLSDYEITIYGMEDLAELNKNIMTFLEKDEVIIEKSSKKGKIYEINIREQVKSLRLTDDNKKVIVRLDTGSDSNLKPMVLMKKLVDIGEEKILIVRTKLYKGKEGRWIELF